MNSNTNSRNLRKITNSSPEKPNPTQQVTFLEILTIAAPSSRSIYSPTELAKIKATLTDEEIEAQIVTLRASVWLLFSSCLSRYLSSLPVSRRSNRWQRIFNLCDQEHLLSLLRNSHKYMRTGRSGGLSGLADAKYSIRMWILLWGQTTSVLALQLCCSAGVYMLAFHPGSGTWLLMVSRHKRPKISKNFWVSNGTLLSMLHLNRVAFVNKSPIRWRGNVHRLLWREKCLELRLLWCGHILPTYVAYCWTSTFCASILIPILFHIRLLLHRIRKTVILRFVQHFGAESLQVWCCEIPWAARM